MSKQPKTKDLEWLILSIMSFNGSGYADMNSAEDYLDSYIAYKYLKGKREAVRLAEMYRSVILVTIEDLLEKTSGATRQGNPKIQAKLQAYRNNIQIGLL